jgi:serine protease
MDAADDRGENAQGRRLPSARAGGELPGIRTRIRTRKEILAMSTRRSRHSALRAVSIGAGLAATLLGSALVTSVSAAPAGENRPEVLMKIHGAGHGRPVHGANLSYHGGVAGSGVVTGADKVYLVYWGSQWNGNDPSGEASIQQGFFNHVGGSSWNNSVTQYCQGVAIGTTTCARSDVHATNPSGVLGGTWYDNAGAAPSHPTQTQLAAEAVRAAAQFGNTTASSNTTVQYVISTATGNNASGFGTQYCAWHSSTSSVYGYIAYTNMPYITDAGASCGANFNGLGANAGITIVGGHEFAETETDIFPNGGWLDKNGAENGDKCAWISSGQGASANVTLSNGSSYPVQSLWSNAFNSGAGGCVNSF